MLGFWLTVTFIGVVITATGLVLASRQDRPRLRDE